MKALELIKSIIEELDKMPKLKYKELSKNMNDLLWCLDSINEANERIEKENSIINIIYYQNETIKRRNKIKNNWLYLLN